MTRKEYLLGELARLEIERDVADIAARRACPVTKKVTAVVWRSTTACSAAAVDASLRGLRPLQFSLSWVPWTRTFASCRVVRDDRPWGQHKVCNRLLHDLPDRLPRLKATTSVSVRQWDEGPRAWSEG